MFSNIEKCMFTPSYIFILLILANYTHAEALFLKTKSTNCTITFQTDTTINSDNNKMNVVDCTRHLCMRNLLNGHCANMQQFQFGKEKCIQQCCGSNDFDLVSCENYNEEKFIRQLTLDRNLMIGLLTSLLGLVIAVIIFAVVYLKCCKKQQNIISKIKKPEYSWKQCNFHQNKQCLKCKQTGAFVVLPCGTFYHLKCLNQNENWQCQHCSKKIKKVKVFCPVCLKKSVLLQGQNFQALDKNIAELYQFHPNKCIEYMGGQMDTERKISVSTKQ